MGHHTLPSRFTSLLLRVAKNVSDEVEWSREGPHFDDASFLVGGRVGDIFNIYITHTHRFMILTRESPFPNNIKTLLLFRVE